MTYYFNKTTKIIDDNVNNEYECSQTNDTKINYRYYKGELNKTASEILQPIEDKQIYYCVKQLHIFKFAIHSDIKANKYDKIQIILCDVIINNTENNNIYMLLSPILEDEDIKYVEIIEPKINSVKYPYKNGNIIQILNNLPYNNILYVKDMNIVFVFAKTINNDYVCINVSDNNFEIIIAKTFNVFTHKIKTLINFDKALYIIFESKHIIQKIIHNVYYLPNINIEVYTSIKKGLSYLYNTKEIISTELINVDNKKLEDEKKITDAFNKYNHTNGIQEETTNIFESFKKIISTNNNSVIYIYTHPDKYVVFVNKNTKYICIQKTDIFIANNLDELLYSLQLQSPNIKIIINYVIFTKIQEGGYCNYLINKQNWIKICQI